MISPARRYEIAAVDALSAALWSSDDADRMFQIVRPRDFHPVDDTIAAAMFDLRRRGVTWTDPLPAADTLRDFRQLWKDRVDSGRFGLPKIATPVEDLLDPDRWPLRFAGRPLASGRIFGIQSHIAGLDVDVTRLPRRQCRPFTRSSRSRRPGRRTGSAGRRSARSCTAIGAICPPPTSTRRGQP